MGQEKVNYSDVSVIQMLVDPQCTMVIDVRVINQRLIFFLLFHKRKICCFAQIYFTDFFLGYEFRNYGLDVIAYSQMESEDRPGTF